MDDGRSVRAVLEATQAKLKQVTLELAALKAGPKDQRDVASRLAHLERSAAEREARDEHRLAEHRVRERALRDRVEALEHALAEETKAHRATQRQLAHFTRAKERQREKGAAAKSPAKSALVGLVQTATAGRRLKRLEAELDASRAEVARLNGLLSRSGGRRSR